MSSTNEEQQLEIRERDNNKARECIPIILLVSFLPSYCKFPVPFYLRPQLQQGCLSLLRFRKLFFFCCYFRPIGRCGVPMCFTSQIHFYNAGLTFVHTIIWSNSSVIPSVAIWFLFLLLLFAWIFLFCFLETEFLCVTNSFGCPETFFVDHTDLQLTAIHLLLLPEC